MTWALVFTLMLGPAWSPPPCESIDGNADGSWCVWTNPDNGLSYVVDWWNPRPPG